MILAIDSSTAWCGVGLYDERSAVTLEERIWRSSTQHSRQLLPEIEGALSRQGLGRSDVTAVAVAIGPGTFNGVRVGVTTAKLLARGLGRPLIGIDTLEVHVAPFRGLGVMVRPLLDAARGEVATALFSGAERIEPDRLAAPAEVFQPPVKPTLFVGELRDEWRAAIAGLGRKAILGTPAQCRRGPIALAELAAERLARGSTDDPATLVPIYLRQPHITQPRVRHQACHSERSEESR